MQPQLPTPKLLTVHTLQALVDYLTDRVDAKKRAAEPMVLHIESPTRVTLCSQIFGDYEQRAEYLRADYETPEQNKATSTSLDLESFIVYLQSHFANSIDKARLIDFMSRVKVKDGQIMSDNGVSQQVTVKRGVSGVLVEGEKAPNPVILRPFRTFPEISQPESPYIFRLKDVGGEIRGSLHLADGGKWQLKAILDIAAWFSDKELLDTMILS
jgi:hypothetical protein